MFDEDIKIADFGDRNRKKSGASVTDEYDLENKKGNIEKAKRFGVELGTAVIDNISRFCVADDSENDGIATQRGVLMTFAATVVIEESLKSSVVSQAAKNSFNSHLEQQASELFKAVGNSGAFSFYYLAYRRGSDVVRRIGQTFAMLCSHDGDPVYQELGEAIYCWFKSLAEDKLTKAEII